MRTTLSLDPDVAAMLDAEQKRAGEPYKKVVNAALRAGLHKMNAPRRKTAPFQTKPVKLGRCLVGSIDDVAEVLAVGEGESFS
ncbi:MAG: DUF2191 domain-containing protein [Chthoniobacterales bacterium]